MTPEPSNPTAIPGRAQIWQRRLVYGWLSVLLSGFLITAFANRDTGQSLSHVSGAWIAISHWATQGLYYPPLEADGHYAGTRFGPLAVALQAGAHGLFNDPIVGPKLLHLLYMLALMAGLWAALRPLGLPRQVHLFLAIAPISTWIGWTAGLTVRHDALSAALQVWAVAVIYRKDGPTPGRVALAAVLAGLAVLAKMSGMWGAAACLFYLIFVAPKRLLVLVPVGLATVGLGLLLVEHFSDGRFSENMRYCLFPNLDDPKPTGFALLLHAVRRFAVMLITEPLVLAMLGLSFFGAWMARRHWPHLTFSCLMVWLMSGYLMTNAGIDSNHLIDLVAVSCLGAGVWLSVFDSRVDRPTVSSDPPGPRSTKVFDRTVNVLLVLSVCAVFLPVAHYTSWGRRSVQVFDATGDLTGLSPKKSAEVWALSQMRPGEQVVSSIPLVPVLLGEDPIVADAWMLRVYFKDHPEHEAAFIRRIEAQEFDAFVFGIDVGPELNYDPQHFGEPVLEAVRKYYELEQPVTAYSVFRPKQGE